MNIIRTAMRTSPWAWLAAGVLLASLPAWPRAAGGDSPAGSHPGSDPATRKAEAMRRVVAAVRAAALSNATRPVKSPVVSPGTSPGTSPGEKDSSQPAARLAGEPLTDHLTAAAAEAARRELEAGLEPAECARALLVGLGVSLDRSGLLHHNPIARLLIGKLETDAEAKSRAGAISAASLQGRTDLLQHFVVAAGLTALTGEAGAWAASLEKEVQDAAGKDRGAGSGFSFADLAADHAGIRFALLLQEAAGSRTELSAALTSERRFVFGDYLPDLTKQAKDREEGLGWKDFLMRFGSLADARFIERVRVLRQEVEQSPGFRRASTRSR